MFDKIREFASLATLVLLSAAWLSGAKTLYQLLKNQTENSVYSNPVFGCSL